MVSSSEEQVYDCIIVGSGLAGMTTALGCLDRGGTVVMLEKEAKLGGNSMKASSGINACPTEKDGTVSQEDIDTFLNDTIKSAGNHPNEALIETLVTQSAPALQWLKDRVQVDLLQRKTRLGGHSSERTFRPIKGAVGYSVMSGMQKALEAYQQESDDGPHPTRGRLKIMTETKMTGLLTSENTNDGTSSVVGVTAACGPDTLQLKSTNVVLATGGFAADRAKSSLLAHHRPDLLHMPATFGDFSTGDGIQLAKLLGAGTCRMDKVQIHPTGFIDPADPSSPSKFLCAELLRGIGGILLTQQGERFCNELGTRDYVVDKMMHHHDPLEHKENKPQIFYILLGSEAAKAGTEHVGFYTWKKLLQKHTGIQEAATAMGIPKETLEATIAEYWAGAMEGADAHGKTFFPNVFSDNLHEEEFLVGKVTPVLHYCMGGLTVDNQGRVLDKENSKVIPGLHAVGEVAGGTHGDNRLAGNSLLECLVFGRIIGENLVLQQQLPEAKVAERDTHSSRVINTKDTQRA